MKEYNELENLIYAIGGQLYGKDRILYDVFENRFGHGYMSFSYCTSEEDKIAQYEIIKSLRRDFGLVELFNKAIMQSDYYTAYRFNWIVSNYEEKLKHYRIDYEPIIKTSYISQSFTERIKQLKELGLDSWRKSNDEVMHHHYLYWINHLMEEDKNYTLWALKYNDTRLFDTFYLSNYYEKEFPRIILQYILDKKIIPDQTNKGELEIISPFNQYGMYNQYKITTSSNMGGMWYLIYLTAAEFQEIYKMIGSKKARRLRVMPFFSYINSFKDDDALKEKFYLYFKK